jgi:RNA recognition motif-containing protein
VKEYDFEAEAIVSCSRILLYLIRHEVTNEEFRIYFSQFGVILDSVVMFDKETGRSRGFGFVTYEDESICQKVLSFGKNSENQNVAQLEMRGKIIEVKAAEPKQICGNRSTSREKSCNQELSQFSSKYFDAPNHLPRSFAPWPMVYPWHHNIPETSNVSSLCQSITMPNYSVPADYCAFPGVSSCYSYGFTSSDFRPQHFPPVYMEKVLNEHSYVFFSGSTPCYDVPYNFPSGFSSSMISNAMSVDSPALACVPTAPQLVSDNI